MWRTFDEFRNSIESGGVTAMEMLAINLKAYGVMSCRSLSYYGTDFDIKTIDMDDGVRAMYDQTTELLQRMNEDLKWFLKQQKLKSLYENPILVGGKNGTKRTANTKKKGNTTGKQPRHWMQQFWSFEQRFYKQLLVCYKVDKTVELVKEAMGNNEQVVVSLWTTGESRISTYFEGDSGGDKDKNDFPDDDGDEIFERAFSQGDNNGSTSSSSRSGGAQGYDNLLSGPKLCLEHAIETMFLTHPGCPDSISKKQALLDYLNSIAEGLPPNPLDYLIEQCGGVDAVAEISGRSKRMVRNPDTGMTTNYYNLLH